jgi:hypothetical protein
MADVRDKLVALHSLVETTLQAHDASFNVYDRPRQLFLDAKSRAKRVSIMGDPIRYAEVTLDSVQADAEPMTRLADGRAIQALTTQAGRTIDRFTIEVLYEYADGASLSASSYAEFLDAVVSKDGSTKSLIGKLRETATIGGPSLQLSIYQARVTADGGTTVDADHALQVMTDTEHFYPSLLVSCESGKAGTLYSVDNVSETVSLENPTIVDIQWIPVDMTGSIYAHYALITIDII